MEFISLVCPLLRSSPFEYAMGWFDFFGDGFAAGGIGVALLAAGFVARNRRIRQAGLAAVVAVLAAGLVMNLLKVILQMSRPEPGGGFGFPSGHTGTAFTVASVLGWAFPAGAPFLYLVAVLAGVARLYQRSHFVLDVVGGGIVGTGVGLALARLLLDSRPGRPGGLRAGWRWAFPLAVGLPALAFFAVYEHTLEAHRASHPGGVPDSAPRVVIKFGAPEARALFGEGWSGDEKGGVWVEGVESSLRLPPLPPADHRVRLKLQPYARPGGRPSCQVVEVAVNGVPAARLLVEKGWHEYELKLPKRLIRPVSNELRFRFAYAESAAGKGIDGDRRLLSVAFASLEAVAEEWP